MTRSWGGGTPTPDAAHRRGVIAVDIAIGLVVLGGVIAVAVDPLLHLGGPVGGPQALLTWAARGVLVLALAWLVIGVLAARTRLVRRPGAAGARATWLASTRPWRARESSLGLLGADRWLMVGVPVALVVATRAIEASLTTWGELSAMLAGWLVFAFVVRALVGRHSPWPAIAAIGGAVVLQSILSLGAVSLVGPEGWWNILNAVPMLRILASALSLAAAGWILVAGSWSLMSQFGPRRAVGMLLAGLGAGVVVAVSAIAGLGSERSPVDLPESTPWVIVAVAAVLALTGATLALAVRGRD